MRNQLLLIVTLSFFVIEPVTGQAHNAVTLSNTSPEAGKSLTLIYDPTGTVLEGKSPVSVMAFYWKKEGEPFSYEIMPEADGNKLKMKMKIPDSIKVFALKLFNGENVDVNNGKGYIYQVYKNGRMVQGARGITASIYLWGDYSLNIKADTAQAKKYMNKEFAKFPSSKKEFTITWFFLLATSTNKEDKALLAKELYSLLKINKEREWRAAQYFFGQLGKVAVADSLNRVIPKKFPYGEMARREEAEKVYMAKDAKKMESLYEAWASKFPPSKTYGQVNYDYVISAVAEAYAREKNVAKALEYANMIKTKSWLGEGYESVAKILLENGELIAAKGLAKRAVDNGHEFMTTRKDEEGADIAVMGYPRYNNLYAEILYHEKDYNEALKYVQAAYENTPKIAALINLNYAKILIALGREQEALGKIDEVVRIGQATAEMKEMQKSLYVKVKGSDAGLNEHIDSLNKLLALKVKEDLSIKMINQPAPMFILKDLDGNTISLKDLKGKIVILDFWATWCGPCIRSFPAMKEAVNKYKEDSNVKFLFIHTWERVPDPIADVKTFIEKNNYQSFQVLMDLKDIETGSNPVVESFKVNGIPAKFVIDMNGNIRFSLTGFEGGDDAAVEEITAMIELAQK